MKHYHTDPGTSADDFIFYGPAELSFPPQAIFQAARRTSFYSLIFVKNAAGWYSQNEHNMRIGPGFICFSNPGDMIQFHFTDIKALYMIRLRESFLVENTYSCIMEEFPFLHSAGMPPFQPASGECAEFERLYEQIRTVYLSPSPLQKKQIGCLLLLLLLKFKERLFQDHHSFSGQGRHTTIVSNFKRMLRKHYQDLYNGDAEKVYGVKEYAQVLGMHPNYLNYIIREKTGQPVSKWIIDKTVAESKSLLMYSSLSIKEIAYRLGFAEASYFCRYFKRYTKVTAVEYRNCSNSGRLKEITVQTQVV